MKLNYYPYHLKFRHPFTISKGTKTHQPTLIVELEHFGIKGYGEAPAITYYNITVEDMIADIEAKKTMIEKFAFTEPERYWHFLEHLLPKNPFLVCALDMAAWDIFGKMARKPLYRLWNGDTSKNPVTDYTIGIDTTEKMVAKVKEQPWPIYKIKVGSETDLQNIKAIRAVTDAVLRVDANAGWDLETAQKLIPQLKELGVEFVEQPLAKDNWEGMKLLYKESVLPLYADESCVSEHDVAKCAGHFHGINIKLTKCSGITPAREMIREARKLGLKVMVGSMNESTIGSAAIAHLLPFIDHVDMDGPLLLAEDLATGIGFEHGAISYSDQAGLGIEYRGLFEK
ncbi:MAG TPA: dipeptide epimerase [Niabella sp.]|nr:dipeptide epimerase [Niabella sp.]HQW15111.1 dipeptide epimerase [Niabella sp.]HQX20252.1 dipeptide epimerase [Niabella sp.]HQX41597.1 dipeptide epimerase [Niabella sp.]HRB07373.1 dipeptide epimerase [Niabella sp.]